MVVLLRGGCTGLPARGELRASPLLGRSSRVFPPGCLYGARRSGCHDKLVAGALRFETFQSGVFPQGVRAQCLAFRFTRAPSPFLPDVTGSLFLVLFYLNRPLFFPSE